VAWEALDEETGSVPLLPMLSPNERTPWAYVESEFNYAPHRQICLDGGESRTLGTQIPLVLVFSEASHAKDIAAVAGHLRRWLGSPGSLFEASRPVLVSYGIRPATLGSPSAALGLLESLVHHGLDVVELRGALEAAEYVAQCAATVVESRKRRVPSRFKVAGVRCQTLRDPVDKMRISWISQLMQIPGVSEEIAKVIAERYTSPATLLAAVAKLDVSHVASSSSEGDSFLAEIEYPIRGKKGTRRVGPIISRRIALLFHPMTPADHVLV
jgi:hypothetical protein